MINKILSFTIFTVALASCNSGVSSTKNTSYEASTIVESSIPGFILPKMFLDNIPMSTQFLVPQNFTNPLTYPASTNKSIEAGSVSDDSMASAVLGNIESGMPYVAFINSASNNSLAIATVNPHLAYPNNTFPNDYAVPQLLNLGSTYNNVSNITMVADNKNTNALYVSFKSKDGNLHVGEYAANSQSHTYEFRILGDDGENVADGPIKDAAISFGNDCPLVAYINANSSGAQTLGVKKFNCLSGSYTNLWKNYSIQNLDTLIANSGSIRKSVRSISLATALSQTVYLAFIAEPGGSGGAERPTLNIVAYQPGTEVGGYGGTWSFIGGGDKNNPITGVPVISENGASEAKIALDANNNLIIAYVDYDTSMLRVKKYDVHSNTFNYIASLNIPSGTSTSSLPGFLTGKDIVAAKHLSLALGPVTVSNAPEASSVGGVETNIPYMQLNANESEALVKSGVKFSNQPIFISFKADLAKNKPAATIVYDGNAWETLGYISGASEVYATSFAIDNNIGYYYASYIDSNFNLKMKFAPQNPYNKILFTTVSQYQGGNIPFANSNGNNIGHVCDIDENNPFGINNSYNIPSNIINQYTIGLQETPLLRGVGYYSAGGIGSPTTYGYAYYNNNYQYLFTEQGQYLSNSDNTSLIPVGNNPIGLNPLFPQTTWSVWTGANGNTCSSWTSLSASQIGADIGNANESSSWWGVNNPQTMSCNSYASLYCVTE